MRYNINVLFATVLQYYFLGWYCILILLSWLILYFNIIVQADALIILLYSLVLYRNIIVLACNIIIVLAGTLL